MHRFWVHNPKVGSSILPPATRSLTAVDKSPAVFLRSEYEAEFKLQSVIFGTEHHGLTCLASALQSIYTTTLSE
jgi:hypothetical protein